MRSSRFIPYESSIDALCRWSSEACISAGYELSYELSYGEEYGTYCEACIDSACEKAQSAAKTPAEREEILVQRISCSRDATDFCDTCGIMLDTSLTKYGVTEELRHYTEHPLETATDAYIIADILQYATIEEHSAEEDALELILQCYREKKLSEIEPEIFREEEAAQAP